MRTENVNSFQIAKFQSLNDITFTSEIKYILTFYWLTHDYLTIG